MTISVLPGLSHIKQSGTKFNVFSFSTYKQRLCNVLRNVQKWWQYHQWGSSFCCINTCPPTKIMTTLQCERNLWLLCGWLLVEGISRRRQCPIQITHCQFNSMPELNDSWRVCFSTVWKRDSFYRKVENKRILTYWPWSLFGQFWIWHINILAEKSFHTTTMCRFSELCENISRHYFICGESEDIKLSVSFCFMRIGTVISAILAVNGDQKNPCIWQLLKLAGEFQPTLFLITL